MSLHSDQLDRAWAKLGMEIKGGRDVRALFFYRGRLILQTRRSRGRGAIEGLIPTFIRQQMKLTENQFGELLACPLGLAGYLEILGQKKLLPQ